MDLKSSHVNPKDNDEFHKWLKENTEILVKIDITEYVENMILEFPEELTVNSQNAKNQDLFIKDPESTSLTNNAAAILHTFVAKGLFARK